MKTWILVLLPVVIIVGLVLWSTGLLNLWTEGMAFVANQPNKFKTSGYPIEGTSTILINLSNLATNIGKELYDDGTHRIYVSWMDNTGSAGTGGYRIGFRSTGPYSLTGATLISGAKHSVVNGNSFSSTMSAQMTAEYNGKQYTSSAFGVGGLNDKDGDEFSFYVFPDKAYETNEITLNEKGTVKLTVTDLYKNIWSKITR